MKNKIIATSIWMCILSLAGLLFLVFYAEKKDYQNLIIVSPDGSGFPSFDLKKVNEICDEEIAVTYDIRRRVNAEATNSTQSVTLIGTNSSYNEVVGLQIVEGGFFSEEVWMMRNRCVVLNEPAAFRLFGSYNIIGNTVKLDGEVWMVTGIVKDGNKKNRIAYVPASLTDGFPDALMAKTGGGTGTVVNSLRRLGIYESDCRVVDISAVAGLFWQQFCIAIYLGIDLLLFLFIYKRILVLNEYFSLIRLRYQIMYLGELLNKSRKELSQMIIQGLFMVLSITIFLFLNRQILQMALRWRDIGKEIKYLSDYFFDGKMQWLMRYFVSGPILLTVFVIALFMIILSLLRSRRAAYANYSDR